MFTKQQIIDMHPHLRAEEITNACIEQLQESDWTQLLDVRATKGDAWAKSWADYRAALRAVINQLESADVDIFNLEWPVAPDTAQPPKASV